MADIGTEQLSAFWKQPTDQYGSYDVGASQATYREQWKGNMPDVVRLYNAILAWKPVGITDKFTYYIFKTTALQIAPLCAAYDPPASPVSVDWTLLTAEVQELEAGDNAMLNLTWGVSTLDIDKPETEVVFDRTDWSLQWQTYSVSPYAFCGNPGAHISSDGDLGMVGKIASRTAIESWFNLSLEYQNVKFDGYYNDGTQIAVKLNGAEKNISKKILQGKTNIVYHYPIVTKRETKNCVNSDEIILATLQNITIAEADKVGTPGSPFDIENTYQWICNGSNVNVTPNQSKNSATITFTTSWRGGLSVDLDFYGPNAWKFGEA